MKAATTGLLLCVAALLALGMVMLYSSSMTDNTSRTFEMQVLWCVMGLIGGLIASRCDYRKLKKYALPIGILALLMLLVVLVPSIGRREIGSKVNGARRWIFIGHIGFQPSEFAKLAILIIVAWYCERFQRRLGSFKHGFLFPGVLIGIPLLLILREPDFGTTLLLAGVTVAMLFIAGARWKFLLLMALVGGLAGTIFMHGDKVRNGRVEAWRHLDEHKGDSGYQTYQGILALGSGGLTGKGLGNSREKMGFLPEHTTDFILPIIGEELGLAATLSVVTTFALLVICGIYISVRASDNFGMVLGSGITLLIGIQAFINIGVVTNTLPNKGMPLPFISRGGSNLLILLTGIGVLLSIASRARVSVPVSSELKESDDGAVPQLT